MKIKLTLLLTTQIIIFYYTTSFSQKYEKYRHHNQFYFEDSTHVFWTWLPNPFSPPTITDSSKGLYCGDFTFYCDLSDTVLITFVQNNDSIVYYKPIVSSCPPHFGLCFWYGGPNLNPSELPDQYYRNVTDKKLKLLIIVNGRKKCMRDYSFKKDWYFWLNESKTKYP